MTTEVILGAPHRAQGLRSSLIPFAFLLLAVGCGQKTVVAPEPPVQQLGCSGGEEPVPKGDAGNGNILWECGKVAACPADQERQWRYARTSPNVMTNGGASGWQANPECRAKPASERTASVRKNTASSSSGSDEPPTCAANQEAVFHSGSWSCKPTTGATGATAASTTFAGDPSCTTEPGAAATPLTAQEVRILVRALPLSADTIDFGRIANFFDLYRHVVETHSDPRKCEVMATMVKAMGAWKKAMGITHSGLRTFSMNSNARTVANWLRPELVTDGYLPFLGNLEFVVESTQSVVTIFFNTYAGSGSAFSSEDVAQVKHQSINSNSIAVQNLRGIQGWKDDVRAALSP